MPIKRVLCFITILFISFGHFANSKTPCSDANNSPESILSHIRYLASDELEGRMSGTPGAEKAGNYIASQFKKAGLKPLGDNSTYFQKFTFTMGTKLGSENKFETEFNDTKKVFRLSEEFNTLSLSSSGQFDGEMVFAGYGISAPELEYDDYKNIDVRDKVVLVLRYTPEGYKPESSFYNYAALRYKAMNAREKGAKAIIFVTPYSQDEEEDITNVGLDFSYSDSGIQALILRRDKAEEIIKSYGKDLRSLEENLADKNNSSFLLPNTTADIKTEIVEVQGETSNIIGFIEGADPVLKDEFIVIGAHYDHIGLGDRNSRSTTNEIHNGADDNASGSAGLIELAKYFSCKKEPLNRSLIFIAFSAEELGLIGASNYVNNTKVALDKTVTMLNMDMVGRLNQDKLTVFGVGSSPSWKDLLTKLNYNYDFELSLNNSGFAPSDQSVFFAKGIPVLHFFTGNHEDYHTPSDDWEKINSKGESKILGLVSDVVEELDSRHQRIAFSNEKESKNLSPNFNVYVGTIPDYSDNVEGVKLLGVKEGSPADRAGIRGDDTIIQFNGFQIKNIYDYVYALRDTESGKPTSLVVLRNYKPLSLIVVPEPIHEKN